MPKQSASRVERIFGDAVVCINYFSAVKDFAHDSQFNFFMSKRALRRHVKLIFNGKKNQQDFIEGLGLDSEEATMDNIINSLRVQPAKRSEGGVSPVTRFEFLTVGRGGYEVAELVAVFFMEDGNSPAVAILMPDEAGGLTGD